jgi:sugar/nucleoside kinase (ribokinase family)
MQDKVAVFGNITIDRVVRRKKVLGYSPGGAINVAYILKELINPQNVLLVSNIGDDNYAKTYIEPELKKMRDDYVRRVKDAETRRYEVNINNPLKPKINRLSEAQKLMNTLFMDITPILPSLSTIHFQSYATVFERKYRNRTIELIKRAYDMKVPVILDWNKRKLLERKGIEEEQKKVLDMSDTVKMNEYEAKLFVEPQNKKKVEKIRLRKRELERLADEIMDNYNINRLIISLADRGSYVQTRHESLRFDALKPQIIMDCIGTGDAFLTAYSVKSLKKLNEKETGVFSNMLGSIATENMFSYPHSITRTRIRQAMITKHGSNYCIKHDVDCRDLASKLGLI